GRSDRPVAPYRDAGPALGAPLRQNQSPVPDAGTAAGKQRVADREPGDSAAPRRPRLGFRQGRSEEHTSELQSRENLVCRLLLENATATSVTYTLPLHDALPIWPVRSSGCAVSRCWTSPGSPSTAESIPCSRRRHCCRKTASR